ncbi:hypothetical protein [Streptomyces sp. NPDC127197]|uniref:hypothetical protein n=1 Tax=Streptomyces sp. NPDC127197 TaxID=3345388 RepID=UPI0036385766
MVARGYPGPAAIGEHVLATGVGRWWADRALQPRAVATSCAGHVVLRGSPEQLTPDVLAPLAGSRIDPPPASCPRWARPSDGSPPGSA